MGSCEVGWVPHSVLDEFGCVVWVLDGFGVCCCHLTQLLRIIIATDLEPRLAQVCFEPRLRSAWRRRELGRQVVALRWETASVFACELGDHALALHSRWSC